jgi:hypothetical protein
MACRTLERTSDAMQKSIYGLREILWHKDFIDLFLGISHYYGAL